MIIYAAADTNYFIEHGLEFINSCVANENFCHVTVFLNFMEDVSDQKRKLEEFMTNNASNLHANAKKYLIKPEYFEHMYNVTIDDNRAYYASFRFLHLATVMQNHPTEDFLVLDIDSIVKKKLPEITADLGLYLRLDNIAGGNLYEQMGMLVAAGILYIPWNNRGLAEQLKAEILNQPIRWFCDQHAILRLYNSVKGDVPAHVIYDFA